MKNVYSSYSQFKRDYNKYAKDFLVKGFFEKSYWLEEKFFDVEAYFKDSLVSVSVDHDKNLVFIY